MVYRLYIANKNYSSWSLRPWVLMRMHHIPFDEILVTFTDGSWRQPQWRSFSPTATVPCLHDLPDINTNTQSSPPPPLVLWESLAIIEHLADVHPDLALYPPRSTQPAARAWARAATAEMHAGFAALRDEMGMNCGVRVALGEPSPALRRDLARLEEIWAEGLGRFGGPFLAGSVFGAVDAMFVPVAVRMQTFVGAGDYLGEPAKAYVAMLLALPPVQEWLEAAAKETVRETLHEEDSIRGRKVLHDLRSP